jgi:hypothetical protein
MNGDRAVELPDRPLINPQAERQVVLQRKLQRAVEEPESINVTIERLIDRSDLVPEMKVFDWRSDPNPAQEVVKEQIAVFKQNENDPVRRIGFDLARTRGHNLLE